MSATERTLDRYLVKSVLHTSQLLSSFRSRGEALTLREISQRCELPKTMVFRLLFTLEQCGMVEKVGENLYQSCVTPFERKLYRMGYAAQGTDCEFSREVTRSIQRAAQAGGVALISLDNRYNPKSAQRNADLLVKEKVDLVFEFQTDENIAPLVAAKYQRASIPFIAIEIPHPGATYYGANNYEAGLIGGRCLGRWAKLHWQGNVEEIVLFELPRAGSLPKMRLTGMLAGIRETSAVLEHCKVTYLDGNGEFGDSIEVMRRHLRGSRSSRVLIGGVNDNSVLGALRAFQEAGREDHCAAMGQNASPEAREELRQPKTKTRLVGSVAYFPEKYGDGLLRLALDILNGRPVPPAVFVKHQLITPETVDHFYPNDQLFVLEPSFAAHLT
jgi:ribose transport system substrate-binding protein